jgi:hypothetical protein
MQAKANRADWRGRPPELTELEIYRRALNRIMRCSERDLNRYVAKVDEIACEALAMGLEVQTGGRPEPRLTASG